MASRKSRRVIPTDTDLIIGDQSGTHFFSKGTRVRTLEPTTNPMIAKAIANRVGEWPHEGDTVVMAVYSSASRRWLVGHR